MELVKKSLCSVYTNNAIQQVYIYNIYVFFYNKRRDTFLPKRCCTTLDFAQCAQYPLTHGACKSNGSQFHSVLVSEGTYMYALSTNSEKDKSCSFNTIDSIILRAYYGLLWISKEPGKRPTKNLYWERETGHLSLPKNLTSAIVKVVAQQCSYHFCLYIYNSYYYYIYPLFHLPFRFSAAR